MHFVDANNVMMSGGNGFCMTPEGNDIRYIRYSDNEEPTLQPGN